MSWPAPQLRATIAEHLPWNSLACAPHTLLGTAARAASPQSGNKLHHSVAGRHRPLYSTGLRHTLLHTLPQGGELTTRSRHAYAGGTCTSEKPPVTTHPPHPCTYCRRADLLLPSPSFPGAAAAAAEALAATQASQPHSSVVWSTCCAAAAAAGAEGAAAGAAAGGDGAGLGGRGLYQGACCLARGCAAARSPRQTLLCTA